MLGPKPLYPNGSSILIVPLASYASTLLSDPPAVARAHRGPVRLIPELPTRVTAGILTISYGPRDPAFAAASSH